MSAMTNFYQNCPICGRSLRVSVKYFGRQMSCSHCHGEFRAGANALPSEPPLALQPETAALSLPTPCSTPQLGEI